MALCAAPCADAATPAESRAKRALKTALAKRYDRVEAVRCKRRPRARGRLRCAWRAQRRPTPNHLKRCRGYHRARVRGRRVRFRRSGRPRCRVRIDTLAPWLGFNDNSIRSGEASADEQAQLTEAVGAGIHSLTLDWRSAEPSPGDYRFENYDRIYEAMLARGVRPLFILAFAPQWARDPLTLCSLDCRYPPSRDRLADWRRFAATVAARYPFAAGIQVWNEPNEREFWRPHVDPARYAELLASAYEGVKSVAPAMPVITGGFSNRRTTEEAGTGLADFIRGIYAAGARGRFDVLGFHAYPESVRQDAIPHTLAAVRDVPAQAGDGGIPLWVTETGLSTGDPDARFRATLDGQASALITTIRTLRRAGVRVVLVHTLLESFRRGGRREHGFGVVHEDRTPKPAFCALARETRARAPAGCPR